MIETAEEFVRLRLSDDSAEQRRAAMEPAAEAVWHKVVDQYPDLRKWVVHNRTVPMSILQRLSNDPSVEVRVFVAMKRSTPPALLEQLSCDESISVRMRVAANASTPLSILRILAGDIDPDVANHASERIDALTS